MLDQHGLGAVFEDDVVLRVAALELVADLVVEVVVRVLGLPVAEGHAQFVQQRAIDECLSLVALSMLVLGDETQVVLPAPALEQILERLAHDGFALTAADFFDDV